MRQTVVSSANAACLTVLGVLLIRNRRRYSAWWSYIVMMVTFAEGLLSLALDGLGANLLVPSIQMTILVALAITLDPTLLEERRLQRALRRMDERDEYEAALAKGMVGRDMSGKGYISLDFFNLFWIFVIGCMIGWWSRRYITGITTANIRIALACCGGRSRRSTGSAPDS